MENQLKATELRIGNYVSYQNWSPYRIEAVDIHHCHYHPEAYKPIQLTEDILLRLGFKEGFHRYGLENYGLKCHKSLKENYWIVSQGFGIQFTELTEIQYLHQLQNLFFSLCDEELTFKN